MKVRSAKAKGRRGQEAVARKIREAFGLSDMDVISTPSSVVGVDIWLSEKAKELFSYAVEVKNTESLNIWKAIAQAEANATPDEKPMVVFSRNRSKQYAVVEFDEILYLLKTNALLENIVTEGRGFDKE